ncbi:hypothetical protein CLV24_10540 [Pontibacter ummariensis]|uniref:Type IX secretion system membrane protein, PorP/SprF family n=1 Tax=Pontibacter ummariensis TaxID=1610492 RepID=A0A239DZF8_9BACT|nr:hypothetical protein [Pontibacter ummariensis]PRY13670.1 hypothetical protein CLV24_10540 [Pontibacter ummariensis]SNS37865.1 hypothetical protein SAMN06296052_105211 [Pontibacter ummariensis]
MKLLFTPLFVFTSIVSHQAQAQQLYSTGARAAALGGAAVALPDLWALQNNVAGIAGLEQPQAGAYVENRFGIQAFTTVALQAVLPTEGYGSYGLSVSRFGDELYSQQHIGLGVAHRLGQFSLGVKADVWQVAVKSYGSEKGVALSVGGQGEIVPNLYVGAYAFNLNQAKLSAFEDERLPTVMKAGLAYRPAPKLLLIAETEKDIDYDASFKAGIEYQVLKDKLALRTGFNTLINKLTFGAGFQARQLNVAYAFGSTTLLGFSHHLSVAYQFDQ